ncbi:HD domain-containing protein [Maridesulfovibrio sp.]|uniref:HD domain-containing protein n=1 Tax=Maridesulfovibrio sp. TaxID=2795000 RepID=UPI002AA76598|nr:HD domain-containing protein [Maridesulfovibrio sp.]
MQYWGKAFEDGQWHHLRRHCIEVAAVMKTLLHADAALRARVFKLSPLDPDFTEELLVYLACVHDLGKFSLCFQHQKPELAVLNGIPEPNGKEHHTELGVQFWGAYKLYEKIGCQGAGVFTLWQSPCVPRTRGDDPQEMVVRRSETGCSPHTRG